jgi:hypothetical protein
MRIYIVVGAIGSGITETCRDVWEGLFEKNIRSVRRVVGRPDNVVIPETVSPDPEKAAEELIRTISASIENLPNGNLVDVILSGTQVNKHALAIRNHWAQESKIIFIRKADRARAIDAGLMLLEHRADFDQQVYTDWITNQIDMINQTVTDLNLEWKNTLADGLNSIEFNIDEVSASATMSDNTFVIAENTSAMPAGAVPRQFAIY